MNKNILFQQHGITDCGPCCICSLAGFYGKRVSASHARKITATGREGTTVKGMVEGAKEMGINLEAVRSNLSLWTEKEWNELPMPVIIHQSKKNELQHYVTAYSIEKGIVTYMDPADGRINKADISSFSTECSGVFLLASKRDGFSTTPLGENSKDLLLSLLHSHKTYVVLSLLCAVVAMSLSVLQAMLYGKVMDDIEEASTEFHIYELFLPIVITLFGINAFNVWYHTTVSRRIDNSLTGKLFGHLFNLPASFFDSMSAGEVASRIFDVARIKGFITDGLSVVLMGVFVMVGTIGILFYESPTIGLGVLGLIPLYYLVCRQVNKYLRTNRRQMMENQAVMTSRITENVTLATKTKQLGWQPEMSRNVSKAYERYTSDIYAGTIRIQYASLIIQTLCSIATIALVLAGSHYINVNTMSFGDVVVTLTVFILYVNGLSSIVSFVLTWPEIKSAANRFTDILSAEEERQSGEFLQQDDNYTVAFHDVSFSYGYGAKVLDKFSFTAKPGEITLIRGKNGAGKSTTAKLLLNLYDADEGEVTIGGIPINKISPASIREIVGYCEQTATLYNMTIRENARCGLVIPDEQIVETLRRTGFETEQLSLDILVGEGGKAFSGGEGQKLCIARMLLRKPAVMVLDEPTAFLDADGTKHIMNILDEEKRKRHTVIVISHDDRMKEIADRIFNI